MMYESYARKKKWPQWLWALAITITMFLIVGGGLGSIMGIAILSRSHEIAAIILIGLIAFLGIWIGLYIDIRNHM